MLVKKPAPIPGREVTDRALFTRRNLLRGAVAASTLAASGLLYRAVFTPRKEKRSGTPLAGVKRAAPLGPGDETTRYADIVSYNNYYELSTDKREAAAAGRGFRPLPWTLRVEGVVHTPRTYDVEALIRASALEERIYRLRCVEGWSMVIPWVGFPLRDLLRQVEPNGDARFIQFETLFDPERLPNQKREVLDWPYVEGLRLDEAMHPLTLLAVGLYGETLPPQNGAPLRLVVPWKYGFKSIKSIVKMRFVRNQPTTTWNRYSPDEYGFYSNVNPNVPHPRWSQAKERRIGELGKRDTLPFNGYAAEVAHLYAGMDLKRYF
jgi:sulfoxide reductase catalytic subunit YedY